MAGFFTSNKIRNMKKLLFCLLTTVSSITGFSQAVTNGGFENWAAQTGYSEPVGWVTFNVLSNSFFGSNPVSVFKDSTFVHSGNYSCKIKSVKLTSNPSPGDIPDTVGVTFTGQVVPFPTFTIKPGYTMTSRPAMLDFWARYAPAGTDTAYALTVLTKWNGTTRDTVATGMVMISANITTFTQYSANLFYNPLLPATTYPDTAVVLFSATDDLKPQVGSELWVDDAEFTGWVSIGEQTLTSFKVFPVPASSELTVQTEQNGNYIFTLFDVNGKVILSRSFRSKTEINVGELATGNYTYSIHDESGKLLRSEKITKVK